MNAASRKESMRGRLLLNEPMAKHTSWRLGGPADRYYVPADLEDLQNFLAALDDDVDLLWVGLGSNLLVRDGGFRGQVIAPLNALKTGSSISRLLQGRKLPSSLKTGLIIKGRMHHGTTMANC